MTEDQIRGATVIVVCNLKPVTMRGVKSYAMLLCASSKEGKEGGGIEFVLPPAGSVAGERVYFEGEKYESEFCILHRCSDVVIGGSQSGGPRSHLDHGCATVSVDPTQLKVTWSTDADQQPNNQRLSSTPRKRCSKLSSL